MPPLLWHLVYAGQDRLLRCADRFVFAATNTVLALARLFQRWYISFAQNRKLLRDTLEEVADPSSSSTPPGTQLDRLARSSAGGAYDFSPAVLC